ncbi:hypothetical protein ACFSL6_17295 [Paenibacillus thailandensis]|uniref:DUF2207 domain-containing protein n=1 Tax=Paenibacillus thailandensis TaxID=393250 RepID=A0ABW5QZD2_9BACL
MKLGKGRFNAASLIILALLVIGVVNVAILSPWSFVMPVAVVGIIFLLYKFPPGRARNHTRTAKPKQPASSARQSSRPRSKTVPFRVIEGGKDDDDLPRYH